MGVYSTEIVNTSVRIQVTRHMRTVLAEKTYKLAAFAYHVMLPQRQCVGL